METVLVEMRSLLNDQETQFYSTKLSEKIRNGDSNSLNMYLYSNVNILDTVCSDGRTPLHDACSCAKEEIASSMVDDILYWYSYNRTDDGNFLNKTDNNGHTALYIATINRNRQVVGKLLNAGADVNLRNMDGKKQKELITMVYERLPEVIISQFYQESNIKFSDVPDFGSIQDQSIEFDFSVITGIYGKDEPMINELHMLSNVFHLENKNRKEVLLSPIVQVFLDLKWEKMHWMILLSMFFHILWYIYSGVYIMIVFMTRNADDKTDNKWGENKLIDYHDVSNIHVETAFVPFSAILMITTLFMTIKEIVEIKSIPRLRTYIKQAENWGQWILILAIYCIVPFGYFVATAVDDTVSVIAVFVAWVLILGQINKHPTTGIYMEMLKRVIFTFAIFLLAFCPILIAFGCVFAMLMPALDQFRSYSIVVKILTMMTGEMNFDDVYDDNDALFKVLKTVLLFSFLTTVAMVLQNLLIGLVVSDIQKLKEAARESSLSTQLEQMYLMEAFMENIMKWSCCTCFKPWWRVTVLRDDYNGDQVDSKHDGTNEPHILNVAPKGFSKGTQNCLRKLFSKRSS